MPNPDPDTTPDLTKVISSGRVTQKAFELEGDLADRMEDGAQGIADAELGDGGPYEDEHQEALPPDIRADQVEREEFDAARDADLTEAAPKEDLEHLEGNLRGPGEADLHALRNSGERAAAVADEKQYEPHGPLTAAPTRKH